MVTDVELVVPEKLGLTPSVAANYHSRPRPFTVDPNHPVEAEPFSIEATKDTNMSFLLLLCRCFSPCSVPFHGCLLSSCSFQFISYSIFTRQKRHPRLYATVQMLPAYSSPGILVTATPSAPIAPPPCRLIRPIGLFPKVFQVLWIQSLPLGLCPVHL
jgi:hypothetical protein